MCMKIEYIVTEHKGKNYTVRVHSPILTAEEEHKRDVRIKAALVQFGRERMRNQ